MKISEEKSITSVLETIPNGTEYSRSLLVTIWKLEFRFQNLVNPQKSIVTLLFQSFRTVIPKEAQLRGTASVSNIQIPQ